MQGRLATFKIGSSCGIVTGRGVHHIDLKYGRSVYNNVADTGYMHGERKDNGLKGVNVMMGAGKDQTHG